MSRLTRAKLEEKTQSLNFMLRHHSKDFEYFFAARNGFYYVDYNKCGQYCGSFLFGETLRGLSSSIDDVMRGLYAVSDMTQHEKDKAAKNGSEEVSA